MRPLNEANWTPEAKPVYRLYPAAIRSKNWPEIVRLAGAGQLDAAKALAAEGEKRSLAVRAENLIARRLRVLSPEKFSLRNETTDTLGAMFEDAAARIGAVVRAKADGVASIPKVSAKVHEEIVTLRRLITILVTDTIWSAVVMGHRHMGEAAKPIFRQNQESFALELAEIDEFENPETRRLIEAARVTVKARLPGILPVARIARPGVSARLPGGPRAAKPDLSSDKWKARMDSVYGDVAKSSLRGLTVSQRIWDLTNRMEQDLKRKIAADIASGKSAREIADRIVKDIYVSGVDKEFTSGPGVYKSPMANADRLARTELSRAYTQAQTSWAKGKDWIQGLRVTLSDAHNKEDVCDEYAGEIYSPEDFADKVPFHPYCQCVGTFVIKEKYLNDPEED